MLTAKVEIYSFSFINFAQTYFNGYNHFISLFQPQKSKAALCHFESTFPSNQLFFVFVTIIFSIINDLKYNSFIKECFDIFNRFKKYTLN